MRLPHLGLTVFLSLLYTQAPAQELLRRSTGLLHSEVRPELGFDREGARGGILYRGLQVDSPLGRARTLNVTLSGGNAGWTIETQTLYARDLFFCLGSRNFLPVFGRLKSLCESRQWLALDLDLLRLRHELTRSFNGRWAQLGVAIHPLANGMRTAFLLRALRFGVMIVPESTRPRGTHAWEHDAVLIPNLALDLRSQSGAWRWTSIFEWNYSLTRQISRFQESMLLSRIWISGQRLVWDATLRLELNHTYSQWSNYEARIVLGGGVRFEVDNR